MPKKLSSELRREYLLRLIRFNTAHRYRPGLPVNTGGGLGSTNPFLDRLVRDGKVKLERARYDSGSSMRGQTWAVPMIAIHERDKILVCPGCERVVQRNWYDPDSLKNHAPDCVLLNDPDRSTYRLT